MGVELPLISATVSRMANPEVNLAAYGGVVFPLSLVIEAPVIMLLVASTARCKDWQTYRLMRNFMLILGGSLTCIHMVLAFTPFFSFVVDDILGVPEAVRNPAQVGLQIMTPWTMAIAVRRFLQGIVIRSGQTRLVGLGTVVRLSVSVSILFGGMLAEQFSGIVVATAALSGGVLVEAVFVLVCVRPVLRELQHKVPDSQEKLSFKQLSSFYWPLAVTPLVTLATLPIGSAAISRMPSPLESLAVWPVLGGLTFVFRSMGFAIQEVVVTLKDQSQFLSPLRQFVGGISLVMCGALFLIASTPLSTFWFESVAVLSPELSSLGQTALWIAVILPAFSPWESLYQGSLVYYGETTRITQAVVLYLLGSSAVLGIGVYNQQITGLYVGLFAVIVGLSVQLLWLWKCNRGSHPIGGS